MLRPHKQRVWQRVLRPRRLPKETQIRVVHVPVILYLGIRKRSVTLGIRWWAAVIKHLISHKEFSRKGELLVSNRHNFCGDICQLFLLNQNRSTQDARVWVVIKKLMSFYFSGHFSILFSRYLPDFLLCLPPWRISGAPWNKPSALPPITGVVCIVDHDTLSRVAKH